jgi:protein-S-isoprenylcysteine O-methyltransferase Ste14
MTQSASTPRLRATLALYLALAAAATIVGPSPLAPATEQLLQVVSLLAVALACFGRIWCSVFIAGYKDAKLVTTGPYSVCRHPLYTLSFVGALGLGAASRSLTLTLLPLVTLAWLLARAARNEEQLLARQFAAEWPTYAATTPRWWPRWSQYRLPEVTPVNARVDWKAFVDAGAFVLLYALVDTAAEFRAAGTLPWRLLLP